MRDLGYTGGAVLVACLAVVLTGSGVQSATLRVPADYPSVLAGVDAAGPGDTVLVAPGTWTDHEARWVVLNGESWYLYSTAFSRPGVSLVAEAGPSETILDLSPAPGLGVTVLVTGESIGSSRIEGFTITGNGEGVAVDHTGRTELSGCRLTNNGLRGISAVRSEVVLENCEISGNHRLAGDNSLYAIDLRADASLEMRDCVVAANHHGGMQLRYCPSILIEGCDFLDNPNYRAGRISYCPDLSVRSSRFFRNSTTASGGALTISNSSGVVEFCVFVRDSSHAGYSGALSIRDTNSIRVANNTFYGCYASVGGAAVSMVSPQSEFTNNVVANCPGGPAVLGWPEPRGCNVFWGNSGGNYYEGWIPDPTDIHADPLFCDPEVGDLTVYTTSPCVAENSPECGAIGALGVGCQPVSVDPSVDSRTWGEIKSAYRAPR